MSKTYVVHLPLHLDADALGLVGAEASRQQPVGGATVHVHLHLDAAEFGRQSFAPASLPHQPLAAALAPAQLPVRHGRPPSPSIAPQLAGRATPSGASGACAAAQEKGPAGQESLPLRNQLGLISQRLKPLLGNLARRGLRYGMVAGAVASATAMMVAPILAPFFLVPAVAVGVAVPLLLLAGVVGGAIAEAVARKLHRKRLPVEDVVALERIYLTLKAQKAERGKLSGEDNLAWHKVNAMLEEMSGGFWRGVRMILSAQANLRPRCGRYEVGSIFPQTRELV